MLKKMGVGGWEFKSREKKGVRSPEPFYWTILSSGIVEWVDDESDKYRNIRNEKALKC